METPKFQLMNNNLIGLFIYQVNHPMLGLGLTHHLTQVRLHEACSARTNANVQFPCRWGRKNSAKNCLNTSIQRNLVIRFNPSQQTDKHSNFIIPNIFLHGNHKIPPLLRGGGVGGGFRLKYFSLGGGHTPPTPRNISAKILHFEVFGGPPHSLRKPTNNVGGGNISCSQVKYFSEISWPTPPPNIPGLKGGGYHKTWYDWRNWIWLNARENNCWTDSYPSAKKKTQKNQTFKPVAANQLWGCVVGTRFSNCSPPARWGLLDFMSTPAPSPSPPPPHPPRRTSTTMITPECSLPDLNHDHPRPVFAAGPQPRPATPSVRCRTSTTTIHAQRSLPDLNHDQPRPVFAAGPQPRPATPSFRCRTSTTTSHAQCSLPDLNHDHKRPVFAAGPQLLCQKLCQIECQKICQIKCQKICQMECQIDMPDRLSDGINWMPWWGSLEVKYFFWGSHSPGFSWSRFFSKILPLNIFSKTESVTTEQGIRDP